MSLQRQLFILACCVLCFGFSVKAGFLTLQRFLIVPSSHPLLAQAQTQGQTTVASEDRSNLPYQLELSSLQQSFPIIPTPLLNNEWQLSSQGVSLLHHEKTTGYIFYGHNWPSLLGNLHKVKIGDSLELNYSQNFSQKYRIVSKFVVTPDHLDVLSLAKSDTIVIYTCTGFLDSQRLVILAQKN